MRNFITKTDDLLNNLKKPVLTITIICVVVFLLAAVLRTVDEIQESERYLIFIALKFVAMVLIVGKILKKYSSCVTPFEFGKRYKHTVLSGKLLLEVFMPLSFIGIAELPFSWSLFIISSVWEFAAAYLVVFCALKKGLYIPPILR